MQIVRRQDDHLILSLRLGSLRLHHEGARRRERVGLARVAGGSRRRLLSFAAEKQFRFLDLLHTVFYVRKISELLRGSDI